MKTIEYKNYVFNRPLLVVMIKTADTELQIFPLCYCVQEFQINGFPYYLLINCNLKSGRIINKFDLLRKRFIYQPNISSVSHRKTMILKT